MQRIILKPDAMIVATAKVAGASVFYSNDEKCRMLATSAGLVARDLPTHSENLFNNLLLKNKKPIKLNDLGETEIDEENAQ